MDVKYKLKIDFDNNHLSYTDYTGHGRAIKINYEELKENTDLLNDFSGKDAYLIGTLLASQQTGKLNIARVQVRYKFFLFISILFVTVMLVSNILSSKLVSIGGFTITGAMLLYPFSYIFDYILTDVYGYQNARRVILSIIVALLIFDISMWLVIILPASPYWHLQVQFEEVFSRMIRTFLASTIAFCCSFFVSSYILQKRKIKNPRGSLFKRIFRSLLISEIFDTGLFCVIAFLGIWPIVAMGKFLLVSYFTKITYELVVYKFITQPVISFIKREEKLDTIDTNTNFTPLKWDVDYTDKNNIYLPAKS